MTIHIENPKAHFLADMGLDILHQESLEWINMISFWQDEVPYLQKLMLKVSPIDLAQLDRLAILGGLSKTHEIIFNQLQGQIVEHEKTLVQLQYGVKGITDEDYRSTHEDIRREMRLVEKEMHMLKHLVFKFSKNR